MNRLLVPLGGFIALGVLSFTLIVLVVLRPWAGPDTTWRTHQNLTDAPIANYTRGVQAVVSPEDSGPLEVWSVYQCGEEGIALPLRAASLIPSKGLETAGARTTAGDPCRTDGRIEFVAHGCASCHGLDGGGGVVGPDLSEVTASEVRRATRKGPKGMPAFSEEDLTDDHVALIVEYLREMQEANQ